MVLFLIKHEWGYGPTGIGTIASLTMDTNSSAANAELVNGAGDSTRRRGHCVSSSVRRDNQSG